LGLLVVGALAQQALVFLSLAIDLANNRRVNSSTCCSGHFWYIHCGATMWTQQSDRGPLVHHGCTQHKWSTVHRGCIQRLEKPGGEIHHTSQSTQKQQVVEQNGNQTAYTALCYPVACCQLLTLPAMGVAMPMHN
jgi:hypothetical protein